MSMKLARHALALGAMILGTWFIGWIAVPIVAFGIGLSSIAPRYAGLHAGLAWLLLLVADAAHGAFGRLAGMLAGAMGIPGIVLIAVTIAFPVILGWSAASVGTALRSIRPAREGVHHVR